jgi:hypothetical protein
LNKENEAVLRMIGYEHRYRVRLLETGQKIEVGVLPIFVLDIAVSYDYRRAWKDRSTPGYSLHEFLPALSYQVMQASGSDWKAFSHI